MKKTILTLMVWIGLTIGNVVDNHIGLTHDSSMDIYNFSFGIISGLLIYHLFEWLLNRRVKF